MLCYNPSMTLLEIAQEIDSLPPEAQKEIEDFIAFLKTRYKPVAKKRAKKARLEEEPFVGMWKGRDDMRDSARWVRDLRQKEWTRS